MPRPRVTWRWNAHVFPFGMVLCHEVPRPRWRSFNVALVPANDVLAWWCR